jgi:hypothetical protein
MKEKEMLKLISNNLAMIISAKDALESLSKITLINSESIKKLAEAIKILEGRLSKLEGRLIIPLDVADEFQIEKD